jgi:hypothetical protein
MPVAVPLLPTIYELEIISGNCLEVRFQPPIVLRQLSDFSSARNGTCGTSRFGVCDISRSPESLDYSFQFCNLLPHEMYFVRVAARNFVSAEAVNPAWDSTKWSTVFSAVPSDQLPDAPMSVRCFILGLLGIRILVQPPLRDGGLPVSMYLSVWDTNIGFISHTSDLISATDMLKISDDGTIVHDIFLPSDSFQLERNTTLKLAQ